MQFQADLFARPVRRPVDGLRSTVLGAAILAGLAAGVWRSRVDLNPLRKRDRAFRPRMNPVERERLLAGWRDAVSRTLTQSG